MRGVYPQADGTVLVDGAVAVSDLNRDGRHKLIPFQFTKSNYPPPFLWCRF